MRRISSLALATLIVGLCVMSAMSQPPEGRPKGPPGKGGPPRFELGHVLPPFVRDEIHLTPEQEKQIEALEREVMQKLSKILTAEQRKKIESIRPPRFDGPPPGGRRGKGGPPAKDKGGPPQKDKDGEQTRTTGAGIQWFATWDAGVAEANRTGRPILLVSAAPHCAGVSGIW